MKIVYHHRTRAQDGSAVHIEGLIDALRLAGAEVDLVAPSVAHRRPAAPHSGYDWMASLQRRMPKALYELAELAYNVPEMVRLWRAVRRQRPDLIYERSNLYLLSGSLVARLTGIPLIAEVNAPYFQERSMHGGLALPRLARWSERLAWKSADAVVAVTQVLADIVVSGGTARERVHVMPNGIDPSKFSLRAVDVGAKKRLGLAGRIVLGFTGFVREWNGLDSVVRFLASKGSERIFLLVVGDGPARRELESLASQLGVLDRVRFTGVIERDRIAAFVSAFDVALQPAANPYASPLKLFEYMALGRAIVAPDQPNIREILQDSRDALLFTPGDSADFVEAVARLAADEALRARLAAGALETLEKRNLTWRNNAERVIDLLHRLGRSPSPEA